MEFHYISIYMAATWHLRAETFDLSSPPHSAWGSHTQSQSGGNQRCGGGLTQPCTCFAVYYLFLYFLPVSSHIPPTHFGCRQGLLGTLLAPLRAATPSGCPSGNVYFFYTLRLLTRPAGHPAGAAPGCVAFRVPFLLCLSVNLPCFKLTVST